MINLQNDPRVSSKDGCFTQFPVEINYRRQIVIYEHKTYADILSEIGGIKAAI